MNETRSEIFFEIACISDADPLFSNRFMVRSTLVVFPCPLSPSAHRDMFFSGSKR
jgi:hypothetical protein